jgi:hypothetical protein
MTELEDVAARFKAWAAAEGILAHDLPDEEMPEEPDSLSDLTDAHEPASATQMLRAKGINFVGINPEKGTVVVCTHRKIGKRDLTILPEETEGGFLIEYVKAGPPQVRLPTSGGNAANAFALHNGRYTCGSSVSIGNFVCAGTLGCLVRDQQGELFGLTNNHVSGGCGYSDPNLPIVAPGLLDVGPGAHDPFTLGHHAKVAQWVSGSPDNVDVSENVDAALFKIKDANLISSMQRGAFDTPAAIADPVVDQTVEKVGRSTGRTTGRVIMKSVGSEPIAMAVPSFQGVIYFSEVYGIQSIGSQPFADRGDSGSLITSIDANGDRVAVGLLFAMSADKTLTLIVPISRVLAKFGVTIVDDHNV